MEPDERLRARMARLEARVDPDVDRQFAAVVERARRRGRRSTVGTAFRDLAITAAVVVIAFTAFALRGTGPAAKPLELGSVAWTTTLATSDPDVAREGLAGTWTVRFGSSGAVTLTAPPAYLSPTTGYRFRLDDNLVVIGLFVERCAGAAPGVYQFSIDADTLRFASVDDPCPHRATLLTSEPWHAAAGPSGS
jgi:hypothetical protein